MARAVLCVLLLFLIIGPATAESQEDANRLVVEAAKLVQSAEQEQISAKRLAQLTKARVKLKRVIDEFPATDLTVRLVSGLGVGTVSTTLRRPATGRSRAAAPNGLARTTPR